MVIANIFQQHERWLYTWTSPSGQYQNQTDYILCSQRWRSSIQSTKTRPRADCGSEHELLVAKFRLNWRKQGKPWGFLDGSVVKNLPANVRDAGPIPGLGRSPGVGNGNPSQYSCLENSIDRGAWQVPVHRVIKSQTWLSTHTHTHRGKTIGPFRYYLNQIPYDYTVEVTSRFKGLDLVEKVPEELWMEVRNIVQEVVTNIIPKKRKAKRRGECLRRTYI